MFNMLLFLLLLLEIFTSGVFDALLWMRWQLVTWMIFSRVPTLEMGSMTPDAQHLALMTNQKSLR
jgi:hypothetical protein